MVQIIQDGNLMDLVHHLQVLIFKPNGEGSSLGMFSSKALFKVPLLEQIQARKVHHGQAADSQFFCPFFSCKFWFHCTTVNSSVTRKVVWSVSRMTIRKHNPSKMI